MARLLTPSLRVLLHLRFLLSGKDAGPDLARAAAEAERNAVLTFLQLLDQFDAGEHDTGILKRFETQHGADAKLHTAMILLNGLITNDKFCLTLVTPVRLRWVRRPRAGVGVRADLANLSEDVRESSGGEHATELANSTSAATDSRCGATVGSSLPTSPGMDPVGRAESSPARDAHIPGGRGSR